MSVKSVVGRFGYCVAIGALGCVLAPAWTFSNQNVLFWPVHGLLVPVGLTLALITLSLRPSILTRRPPGAAEWLLYAFVVVGAVGTLHAPATLGRLIGPLEWLEATILIAILARLADARAARHVLLTYSGVATVAALCFLISDRLAINTPFLIYPNHFALLLALPVCVFANEVLQSTGRLRILYLVCLGVLVVALALTRSRAVLIGFAIAISCAATVGLYRSARHGGVATFILKMSALAIFVVVLLVLLEYIVPARHEQTLSSVLHTLLYPSEGSFGGRLRRWQNALPLVLAHPLVGGGFGSWFPSFDAYRHAVVADSAGYASALNTYILLAAETGVVGLALFIGFCGLVLFRPVRQTLEIPIRIAFIIWLIALTFHSVADFPIVLFGFAFTAGMALWCSPSDSEQSRAFSRGHVGVLLAVSFIALAAHGRHALGSLEGSFANDLLGDTGNPSRLLWRLLTPISAVIDSSGSKAGFLSKTTEIGAALDWTQPGGADPRLSIAGAFYQRQNYPQAEAWYRSALLREPTSPAALLGICRSALEQGQMSKATGYCERVLSRNPTEPAALETLASIDIAENEYGRAFDHLSVARRALWNRLDLNDFGTWTLGTVSDYYQSYRHVSELRRSLVGRAPDARLNVGEEIEQTPLLHSVVAPWGCKLYFSANINARYNVWLADSCNPAAPLELKTNGSRTPYQLQATRSGLYFMSDHRGDGLYELYFMAHDTTKVVGVALPPGVLTQYEANRHSDEVAAVVFRNRLYRLLVGSLHDGFHEVYATEAKIEGLDWHPKSEELAFTEAGRVLKRWNSAKAVPETLIGASEYSLATPAYSPAGSQLAVSQRTGQFQSKLLVCELAGRGSCRSAFSSDSTLAIEPVWLSESEIAFREEVRDEYLLRRLNLDDKNVTPIGIAQGVVYRMVVDPITKSLWFCEATQTEPIHIASIHSGSDEAIASVRLDGIEPSQVLPAVRSYLDAATVYTIMPPTGNADEAIVLLHGGGSSFSPRWNSIAQQLANGGYRFVALNYSIPWSVDGAENEDWSSQAGEVEALVQRIRTQGVTRVHLLGVSTGTKVLQAVLRRDVARIESAIELSPIRNEAWNKLHLLPPMLIVTGANDPLLGLQERTRQVEAQRAQGSAIDLLVLPNEGHELRAREAIDTSMSAILTFLSKLRDAHPAAVAR
jgi:O-antigen ligase/predicted esterase/tetratricopeptide (TPR) repeat protein